MADVKELMIGNVVYSVKDETARNELKNKQPFTPMLADVQAKQVNSGSQQTVYGNYAEFKGKYAELIFYTNLYRDDLIKYMNSTYITVSRFKRQQRAAIKVSGEDVNIRERSKFNVQNDQRVKLDTRAYCWKFCINSSSVNPQDYKYFYTMEDYSSVQQLINANPNIGFALGFTGVSNYGTNLNILEWDYELADIDIDSETDVSDISRVESMDINTYININNTNSAIVNYINGPWECLEYTTSDNKKVFLWCDDWGVSQQSVYGMYANNDYIYNYVPDFFDELSDVGYVSQIITNLYNPIRRTDLDFKKFDIDNYNLNEFCAELYGDTLKGNIGDTHVSWHKYWMDYPIIPTLLANCDVITHRHTTNHPHYAGSRVRLKDVVKQDTMNEYFYEDRPIAIVLPWDTYYLWMRFCSYQKRCFYDDTFTWSEKNNFNYGVLENSNEIFGRKPFGRQRGGYRIKNPDTQIAEFLQFNLANPYNIIRGTSSIGQPIQKRLIVVPHNCYQTLKN